jgi:antitoxin MazE
MVEVRVVRWGNSRGVRIPRPMLEQLCVGDSVTMEVRDGEIVIRPSPAHPRAGWAESFRAMAANGDTEMLWPDAMTDAFDKDHPEW